MLFRSPVMESLRLDILKAASVDADVLILGETGTGKQLAAEAIHRHSARSDKPFVSINCGALDENLLLDELFGHVKGAFTEARTIRKGAFLVAQGGILFLDEIGTASAKVQQALLRTLSVRKIAPLGSDQEQDVDVRVIAATNEDLKELIDLGRFREDLFYRLNVITVRTPPLRDHREDIPVLAESFLNEAGRQMNKEYMGISRGALETLKAHHWPGNVRELRNAITRAVAMAEGSLIHSRDIELEGAQNIMKSSAVDQVVPGVPLGHEDEDDTKLPAGIELNERQKKVFPILLRQGEISRSEYQKAVGNGLPTRTAVYDLQDLARRGIVVMTGRGPATRYKLIQSQSPATKKTKS